MYYMMICQDPEKGYLATLDYDFSEDEDPMRDWMAGERFEIPPPEPVRAIIEPRTNTVLAEMWQVPLPIMSRRLHDALLSAGVSNLDVFPAKLEEKRGGKVHEDFVAFNIVGLISAAKAKARSADDVLIQGVDLDQSRAGGALMFRLAESVNAIVVHESVKRRVEELGITTMTFLSPEDWTG
ncbi:hypothetical protein BH11PSE9_BH11PSE9_04270 [soil metagenome]